MAPRQKTGNCQDCYRPDEVDDMVGCDNCLKWWHFRCAGVDKSIVNEKWTCFRCKVNLSADKVEHEVFKIRDTVEKLAVGFAQSNETVKEIKGDCATSKDSIEKLNQAVQSLKDSAASKNEVNMFYNFAKSLPCKTLEELDDILLQVTNSELRFNALVAYIQSFFGGKDVKKNIKKSLDNIMHKDVQKRLSWSGFRTDKPSFESCYKPIVNAIHQALLEKFKDYDYEVLENKIKTLLQNPK